MDRKFMAFSAVLVVVFVSFAGVSMFSEDFDAVSDSSEPVILTDGGSGGQASNPVSDLTHFNSLESELRIFDIIENTRSIYVYVGTPVAILTSSFSTVCYGIYFVTDGFGLSVSGDAVHESCPDSRELHGTISKAGDFSVFYYQSHFDSDGNFKNQIRGSFTIHAVEMAEPDDGGDTPVNPDPDENPDDPPVDPDPDDSESEDPTPSDDAPVSDFEIFGIPGTSFWIAAGLLLLVIFLAVCSYAGGRRR